MYQLDSSVELIPSNNNTLIYLPKMKQFASGKGPKHNHQKGNRR